MSHKSAWTKKRNVAQCVKIFSALLCKWNCPKNNALKINTTRFLEDFNSTSSHIKYSSEDEESVLLRPFNSQTVLIHHTKGENGLLSKIHFKFTRPRAYRFLWMLNMAPTLLRCSSPTVIYGAQHAFKIKNAYFTTKYSLSLSLSVGYYHVKWLWNLPLFSFGRGLISESVFYLNLSGITLWQLNNYITRFWSSFRDLVFLDTISTLLQSLCLI